MTIEAFLPQWVRVRLRKPRPSPAKSLSKKEHQVLPTVELPAQPPVRLQDDDSPPGFRINWRM